MKKQILNAKEYSFVYETKTDKFLRDIQKFEFFILISIIFTCITTYYHSPFIILFISLITAFMLKINSIYVNSRKSDLEEEIVEIGEYFTGSDYLVHMGDAVTSIKDVKNPAAVWNPNKSSEDGFNPEAVKYPILIKDTTMLTHMFVIGTTGAGKTTFLVNILQQLLMLGSGCLAVDGKGDQTVYEAFWNTAVHCGREDDFMVMNFNKPEESNTMNPLLEGSADEITDIIGAMLETGGDNSFWSGRALAMMKGILSILVPLKDNGLLFDADGHKQNVLTFSFIGKWIDIQNLKSLYFTLKKANEEKEIPSILYGSPHENDQPIEIEEEDRKDYFNRCKHVKLGKIVQGIDISRLEQYLSSVYLNIHDADAQIEEGTSKQHGNSFLMWNEALDLLSGRFGLIFDTEFPEINMSDVVSNGRVLYILLPALKVDPRTLGVLGKLILGFFKQGISVLLGDKISGSVEDRYKSFAIRPRVPFWGVMDEYGAYAVEGFDNVLAQARSLRVSICILVQEIASLKKSSELEAQRLLGNTGLKVVLKLEEQKSVDEVIEFLGKQEVANVKINDVNDGIDDRKIDTTEQTILKVQDLKEMTGGHAYIMWAGKVVPALVRFYEPPISPVIPEFISFRDAIVPFYEIKDKFIKNINESLKNIIKFKNEEKDIKDIVSYFNKNYKTNLNQNKNLNERDFLFDIDNNNDILLLKNMMDTIDKAKKEMKS